MDISGTRAGPAGPLPPALERALEALSNTALSGVEKGLPDLAIRLGEIGGQGWNVLAGDVPLPAMVLLEEALEHNINVMQAYCDRHGALFAPHGKTPMAPQLYARQLQAGAWAITVANVAQLQVCRAFGLQRIFLANELVAEYDLRYVAGQLRADPDLELFALVDSEEGVKRMQEGLERGGAGRPLAVLVELGAPGGRTGARDIPQLLEVAEAVGRAWPALELVGVEGYEGAMVSLAEPVGRQQAAADGYLRQLAEATRQIRPLAPQAEPFLVSAGGSMYFDRVVEFLGREALPEAQLILRPGCYISHDSGLYERYSPMSPASDRFLGKERLQPALEIWSVALSRPEPDLVLLGMGRRDVPTDSGMPVPKLGARGEGTIRRLSEGYEVLRCNDQHAFLRLPAQADLRVGDLVGCGISHPCTAFDKWRLLFVVDGERNIVDAVRTFF